MPPPVPTVSINKTRADYVAGLNSFANTIPWSAAAAGATSIEVQRVWAGRTATIVTTGAAVTGNDPAPVDVDVAYRARSVDASGKSAWSALAS